MSAPPAGDLTVFVDEQKPTGDVDALGAPADTWRSIGRFWAKLELLQGRELESARQLAELVTHRLTTHYRALVPIDHRLVIESQGLTLNVATSFDPDYRHERLVILATADVDEPRGVDP